MLLGNKKCPKCETLYDVTLESCPHCEESNADYPKVIKNNKIFWVSIRKQIAIFLLGIIGLTLFNLIFSLIAQFITPMKDNVSGNAIVMYVSYGALFITLIAAIWTDIPKLKNHFNKYQPYVLGILMGVILILFNIGYNNFVNLFYQMDDNLNQQTAVQYVKLYPVASFFILGLIGPICEELAYRVGLFSLVRRINRVVSYILSALIFGLIHFDFTSTNLVNELVNLPIYVLSGVALCFTYEKFGLASSITAHIVNNVYSVISIIVLTQNI